MFIGTDEDGIRMKREEEERFANLYRNIYSGYEFTDFIVLDLPSGHNWVEFEETRHVCTKCSQEITLLRSLYLNNYGSSYTLKWFLKYDSSLPLTCSEAVMKRALL